MKTSKEIEKEIENLYKLLRETRNKEQEKKQIYITYITHENLQEGNIVNIYIDSEHYRYIEYTNEKTFINKVIRLQKRSKEATISYSIKRV